MDWGIVAGGALAVAGGALTIVGGMVADLMKDRRLDSREVSARAAQREFDRSAFQRQTLLELQEALDTLTATYVEAWLYLLNASGGKPDLGSGTLSPHLQGRLDTIRFRVRVLNSRVVDEPLRDLVTNGLHGEVAFLYRSSVGEAHEALAKRNQMLGDAMLKCGEIVRGLP